MENNIFYRDQEGRPVQVLSQAVMKENGRAVVLYQELFGSYARKVEYRECFLDGMRVFDPETERVKTDQAPERGNWAETKERQIPEWIPDAADIPEPAQNAAQELLMAFLDAQTHGEKLEILSQMKDCVTDYLIDTMALSLDMEIPQGVLEDRYQKLIRSLRTVMKYETNRLR